MKAKSVVVLVAFAVIGFVATVAMPAAWFSTVFFASIAITLVLAVGAATFADDSKPLSESRPVNVGLKAASFVFLGTSRPNAIIALGGALSWFLLAAAFTLGLGLGILWLANA